MYLCNSCFISQHLETVIKSKIPGIQSLINKTIAELEAELTRLGKPVAADAGVSFLSFALPVLLVDFLDVVKNVIFL